MKLFARAVWSAFSIIGCILLAAGCGGAGGATTSTALPLSGPTLPPMGVYNSCEIDTALSSCESQDSAIAQEGFAWELNQIGLSAKATGSNSLQAWFTYDASIGLGQVIMVTKAISDPSNVLTGDILITGFDSSLSNTCPGNPTTNEGIIQCIYNVASSVPGFKYEWYLYDEPGCPNQSIGYCTGTLAGDNYQNVQTLAQYIASIDPTHAVRGVNVGGGCSSVQPGGCTVAANAAAEAAAINNLYSCNGQSPCSAWSSPYTNNWLTSSYTPNTGFDFFPIPENIVGQYIGDIGYAAGDLANTVAATYPSENISFTVQAFSWMQEGWTTRCSNSYTVCPFPTATQMQEMRDEALYYAKAAGHPMNRIFWYEWAAITCEDAYPGCSSSANLAAVRSAMTAPYPAAAPPQNL
jgi:hypothetical protein